jgi:hypothetical protein
MDDITRQVLVLTRKIQADIRQALSELRSIQQMTDSGYEEYSTDDHTETAQKDAELFATIKALHETQRASEAKKYSLDHRRYRLEWKSYNLARWTAAFLLLYTTITAIIAIYSLRSANAARDAANTADKTMKLSFRPRITLLGINPSIMQNEVKGKLQTTLDHGRLYVGIELFNTGPLAARNVRFFRFDNVGTRDKITKLAYEELFGESKVIPPKTGNSGPGMAIFGKRIIANSELEGLKSGTLVATFSILVAYDDDFGITHHTEYCDLFTLQPYNDICPWPVQND